MEWLRNYRETMKAGLSYTNVGTLKLNAFQDILLRELREILRGLTKIGTPHVGKNEHGFTEAHRQDRFPSASGSFPSHV